MSGYYSSDFYYVLTVLRIYYNETDSLHLILKTQQSNFYCNDDEDDILYEEKVIESRKRALKGYSDKTIIIYDDHKFLKLLCENKYKNLVEQLINEYDKKWDDITRIIKVEERIESNKLTYLNGRMQIKN